MNNFSSVLKDLRIRRGVTQAEMAKAISVAPSTIAMYEGGKRSPSYEILETIADYFNVGMDYLLGKTEKSVYVYDVKEAETMMVCEQPSDYGVNPKVKRIVKRLQTDIIFFNMVDLLDNAPPEYLEKLYISISALLSLPNDGETKKEA